MAVFRYNYVLIMYFCVHAMVLFYPTGCKHSDLHIVTWLMWFRLKSTVTQSLLFSDCTWSVSHSNSVHCLISEHILISVNITFCCVWYDLGNNILFYYDFLTADFKLHISSILSYRGCRKGAYMYFCLALVSLASITRDLF